MYPIDKYGFYFCFFKPKKYHSLFAWDVDTQIIKIQIHVGHVA